MYDKGRIIPGDATGFPDLPGEACLFTKEKSREVQRLGLSQKARHQDVAAPNAHAHLSSNPGGGPGAGTHGGAAREPTCGDPDEIVREIHIELQTTEPGGPVENMRILVSSIA